MASAWGDSWGGFWGNSWGIVEVIEIPIEGRVLVLVSSTASRDPLLPQYARQETGIDVVATLNPTVHTRATDRAVVSVKARSGVRVDSEASQLVPLPSKVTRRVKIRTTPRKSVTIGEQE